MKMPDFPLADNVPPALREWMNTAHEVMRKQTELLQARDQEIQNQGLKIQNQSLKIEALTLELAHHRRTRFGQTSEALSGQPDLFQEDWAVDEADLAAQLEKAGADGTTKTAKPPRQRAGRQPLPPHLPRIDQRHEPESCTCGACGQDLKLIREEITEQLDVIPATFRVIRHIRPQYACRHCETVVAEPAAAGIIDGGLATTALLAWVMVCKYMDHLPLYRLEQMAARQGLILSRSTLADWVGRVGLELQPLVDALIALLLERQGLHADETPMRQLDPGQGKTRQVYLWAYRSNNLDPGPPIIVFDYQTGRAGHHARKFLNGWKGHLVVDDYGGYKKLFDGGVVEVGCWAHARRKFFDLHTANQSLMAVEALRRIGLLYEIESRGRFMSVHERQALRQAESVPVLESLHEWLQEQARILAPNGGSAKAVAYTLRRWPALRVYADSGNLPIDNNPVENSIRPIALGKKNWLFAGSERAGRRAAAIQSLLGTAKLNGIEPLAWLTGVLEKLPTWKNHRLEELLPLRKEAADQKEDSQAR
jgi:transposase